MNLPSCLRLPLFRSAVLSTIFLLLAAPKGWAATFVVPADADLVRSADAIVVGTAISSYAQQSVDGDIETVTWIAPEEVIRGPLTTRELIQVVEPGGEVDGQSLVIPGSPHFAAGERLLLLLRQTGENRWSTAELVLGKFSFADSSDGKHLLLREDGEIEGWTSHLQPYVEPMRLADEFLNYVRNIASGATPPANYFLLRPALPRPATADSATRRAIADVAPYTATSYTMTISGSMGARWTTFPSAVRFYQGNTEPGAPGGGTTAITAAFNAWNNDCGSNVNYVLAGNDASHTQGLHGADGENTIFFEQDLSHWGVSPFTCSSNSYSGTLGLGGITSASGQNTVNGEAFVNTNEADVEMNRGLANCTLLFNNGDFNSAVTHEVGHTLGFRHADQDRNSSGTCSSDPSLECSNNAIMKSFVTSGINARLQTWDQHAVQAVYPGNVCAPGSQSTCTPPAITSQPVSSTVSSGSSVTLSVGATGTGPLSYQWYIGSPGSTGSPVNGATGSSITVNPTSTITYWVLVSNSCGSADSSGATLTVAPTCSAPSINAEPANRTISQGQQTTLAVSASGTSPLTYQWYTGTSGDTSHPLGGQVSNQITVAPTATTSYWVRVSNSCGAANSTTAVVTVSAASCVPVSITGQPSSQTVQQGNSATMSVGVSGTTPVSYQWYIGTSGNTSSPISGAINSTLTVAPSSTTSYWVHVANSCGAANSGTATITVAASCVPPTITAQPVTQSVQQGSSVTLAVGASGSGPLSYQWFIGTSGNTSNPIGGAAGPSLTVSPATSTSYWARVTNACGAASSVTATVTVTQFSGCTPPSITGESPSDQTIAQGSTTTLQVAATGTNLSDQWFIGSPGSGTPIPGATGNSITVAPSSTTTYWLRISNSCGSINSAGMTVTVTPTAPPEERHRVARH